ncbi:XRE family transcriptional regulator [Streptomyces rectiverticillatus]|uniref:XRE family transcriptional regulator n=1 Tax=Streptomyces rectiverticillatus TaxID=173860 RepID=UPI0015C3D059|nr:XRE family transcriptional regulator [Streptomyces rectiverticillatus]QLE73574.1 XRE family transcriptional regulator [Streptomyces rectiverticillatus]
MPRWRALPEELDPEVREFTEQLRRLVERSGLSIGAVADRTGYSKTSWERYLGGRLLPPLGAAEALAEATGTDVVHLSTMWELAERAWSRSELRHDSTVESARIARARAALGEFGPPQASAAVSAEVSAEAAPQSVMAGGRPGAVVSEPLCHEAARRAAVTEESRAASPAGSPAPARAPGTGRAPGPAGAPGPTGAAGPSGPAPRPPVPGSPRPPDYRANAIPADGPAPRRRAALFVTGVVGALLVVAAVVLLLGVGEGTGGGSGSAPPLASPSVVLPAGVKCAGAECSGKDPEAMGCGGGRATTAGSATVGTSYVEVRYSQVCGAAWARITQAAPGDAVRIDAAADGGVPARSESGRVVRDADGYTPMVAVSEPGKAKACAALTAGPKGCTVARAASAPAG